MFNQLVCWAYRPTKKFSAAIGANAIKGIVSAVFAERAFERATTGVMTVWR